MLNTKSTDLNQLKLIEFSDPGCSAVSLLSRNKIISAQIDISCPFVYLVRSRIKSEIMYSQWVIMFNVRVPITLSGFILG